MAIRIFGRDNVARVHCMSECIYGVCLVVIGDIHEDYRVQSVILVAIGCVSF